MRAPLSGLSVLALALLPLSAAAAAGPSPLAPASARIGPAGASRMNATVVYPWAEGALFQVTAAVGRVTDIMLEPGERLVGEGPVAAGDTARWIIGTARSGAGAAQRPHVLVKPTLEGLSTNLVITTDRRVYHLELATGSSYMAAVGWRYPAGELAAVSRPDAGPAEGQAAQGPEGARLNFGYRIEGRASFRPERVYDDGARTYIDLPAGPPQPPTPPLYLLSPDGRHARLVNYRVLGRRIVVDRLFDAAELRLGDRRGDPRVRLVREPRP